MSIVRQGEQPLTGLTTVLSAQNQPNMSSASNGCGASSLPNFEFDRNHIMNSLEEKGYCVVSNILTSEKCDLHVGQYRHWLAQFGEDDFPFQSQSLIQSYRVGHFEPTWAVRLASKKVFETVWQTKKLLTSFDAIAIAPPPEEDSQAFDIPGSTWLHLDQSAKRTGFHCYQGAVYLEEASQTDYCFRVLRGSHKYFADFYERFHEAAKRSTKHEFYKLKDDQVEWFKKRDCILEKIPAPKGSIILWDSRTVHDNCRPERGRPNSDRWRFVVFVCMTPARWASERDLALKRQAYKKLIMTTHWPSQGVDFFKELPSQDGVPLLTKLPDIARSTEAQLLAGVKEYNFDDGEPNGPEWMPTWADV